MILNIFHTLISSVSIVDFEQVNVCWDYSPNFIGESLQQYSEECSCKLFQILKTYIPNKLSRRPELYLEPW